ncbi:FK506-binding protein 5-like [Lucilia cuprina]|uniref:FK506-binding protein 5-like n=1 Tax=Lucilia cuprina TaxID=7375 RepID=UPI001F051BA7|nr:FK506-binding protein 5-like [Lucilia cuprina]
MKMSGRKTSAAYELYGFIPKVENGKHAAICTSCNRVLQNTAAIRLQKHRNSCLAARANGGDPVHFPNLEIKKRITPKTDTVVQQNENINANVKTEQSNMEFEDATLNDNANDNATYEDVVEATNTAKRLCKTLIRNDTSRKTIESSNNQVQNENPLQSPITTTQTSHRPEPFETYHATTTNTSGLGMAAEDDDDNNDDDDNIEEVNDEDLINIEQELDVIQNLMPRSKESKQLQDELSKAETEYYRSKAAYFKKLSENCNVKRTLMLLESRKLQLEIERLTNES